MQKNKTTTQNEEENQSIETDPATTQTVELVNKDIKIVYF